MIQEMDQTGKPGTDGRTGENRGKTGDRREVSRLGKRAEVQQQDGDDENKNLRGI
jgi:hypothetical protein